MDTIKTYNPSPTQSRNSRMQRDSLFTPDHQSQNRSPMNYNIRNSIDSRPASAIRTSMSFKEPITESPITTSRPSTAGMYQDIYAMESHQAKHFLENELIRVTTQRDLLNSEYQKLPVHGGRANVRLRKDKIEDELDERESEIGSLRKKMRDIGIL